MSTNRMLILFGANEVNNLFAQPFTSLKFEKINLKKK